MKKLLFMAAVLICVFVSGCKKDNETNVTSNWVGVYTNPTFGSGSNESIITSIIVSQTSASTLKIQLKAVETSYIYNYTTLQSVAINTATTASIDETEGITQNIGQYHIKGTVTMKGSNITLVATATNVGASKETQVENIYFSGDLQK